VDAAWLSWVAGPATQPSPALSHSWCVTALAAAAVAACSVEQCVRHGVDFNSPYFKAECEGNDVVGSFYPDEHCTGQGRNQVSISRVCTPIRTHALCGFVHVRDGEPHAAATVARHDRHSRWQRWKRAQLQQR
jgi:hypothetical protein